MTKRKGKGVSGRDFCTKHDLCLCDPEDGPDPDREHDARDSDDRDEADARAWADVPKNGEVR